MRRASSRSISIDRKSTRLNSSHLVISYAVFCLKKKKVLYAPGSETQQQLGSGVKQFADDGAGSVVQRNTTDNLIRFAPGSTLFFLIDSAPTEFSLLSYRAAFPI